MKKWILFFGLGLLLSCVQNRSENKLNNDSATFVKYAKGFDIEEFENHYKLTIKTPYQKSEEYSEFILVKENFDFESSKSNATVINIPLKKVIATSTTHIPMIEILNEENSLIGFPNMNYVSSLKTRKLIDQGLVKEIGMDANLNTEVVLSLNPELIIGFSVSGSNKSLETLKRMGLSIIYNGAWLEETPLGRAEWLKFFGVLYDKKELADSIFNAIERDYNEIKILAAKTETKPTILSGSMFKDIWNLPAGESFAAQFLKDANTDYLWKNSKGTGSLQLNFENILDKSQMADLWIDSGSYVSKEQLLNANPLYAELKPFKTNSIYTFSKRKGPTGGTIYYEIAPTRPDLVLKDMIKI
ncbi:MAG: ABC transporter substrate-binding protein, partial [Flavobacteriaceae bacterium]|nr:ABC transporter substrate-binding protein [Flavobacteriaceae bacterium]